MKKPNLETIENRLKQGQDFELTGEEYRKQTGADFPKNKSYAKNKSAVANLSREHGYIIEIIPMRIIFRKAV